MDCTPDGATALDDLFWRAEVLQAMYWMLGEGLAEDVNAEEIARFLVADVAVMTRQLPRLASEGYLEESRAGRFRLSEAGRVEGARSFQDEFAGLTKPGHYECAPGCWCQDPEHAGEPCPTHPETPAPAEPTPSGR